MSVAAHIIIAFGICIVALGIVMVTTTRTSLQREHERTLVDLRASAVYAAEDAAVAVPETVKFLGALTTDPNIGSFEPARCRVALAGLAAFAQQGNIFVVAPDRSVVCHLKEDDNIFTLPAGDWVARVQNDEGFATNTTIAADTGRPLINLAVPVPGATGVGALVTTWDADAYGLEVPKQAARGIHLVELDATRSIVIAASENAPVKPGRLPADSWMRSALGADATVTDSDGVARYWQETRVRGVDRFVLAGIPVSTALTEAHVELRRNVVVGLVVVFLIIALSYLMQRRIAKPVQALTAVIIAAAEAEHEIEAVPEGPKEIAAVASAFNATMGERRELERDLADTLKEARRASKLKSEFLANMSHEIRTPMNGVLGMLSLLDDADVDDEVRDCLRTMGDSANALMAILNEMLDFSKLEAGMVMTDSVPFNVREVVRGAISPWVTLAGRKDVPLTATVEPDVPETAIGDPARVRQVLANLVDNAVKFTPGGHITVRAVHVPGDRVRFEISDSGIGISEEGRTHLFEPFVQADGTTTRRYGGTGLGLAICRQLVELMGGRIGLDSNFGVGSTFWFELPLAAAAPAPRGTATAAVPAPAVQTEGPATTMCALVVDDNLVNQKVATQMLHRLGYEVTVASDGLHALRVLDARSFDAVLMDVQMPVMDGLEATTELRRRGQYLPVIAMTASALPEDRERCRRVGMDGYVVKPMTLDSLQTELTRVLSARVTSSAASASR